MTSDTRAKMVAGAADLMSRRGVDRHQPARCGPPYRHAAGVDRPPFPGGGKQQLIEDALVFCRHAGLRAAGASDAEARRGRRPSRFHWPVAADAGGARNSRPAARCSRWRSSSMSTMRRRKAASRTRRRSSACSIWRTAYSPTGSASCSRRCGARGLQPRARGGWRRSSSVEGTVAMCRAARSAQPLDDVGQELELVPKRAGEVVERRCPLKSD